MSESLSASIIAEIQVSAERVALADALSAAPGMAVEFEGFEPLIENDPTVAETKLLDRVDGDSLFRVE